MQQSIVCGVDGSQESRSAAQVAARLARTLDLRLVLAYAIEDPPTFPYGDARLNELRRRGALEDARPVVDRIGAALPGSAPETRVVLGDPIEKLPAVGREAAAELMVVGSRGRGPLAAALLGSVSAHLASTAECPVVVVPTTEAAERFLGREASGGSIVCGVDGSPESGRAVQVAGRLAERMGLQLLPVHVGGHGAPVGDPVEALRRRATGHHGKLIAVGSRGRGALGRAVLGSVSATLAATAPVPVLVVPPTADVDGPANGMAHGSATVSDRTAQQTRGAAQTAVLDAPTMRADVGRFSEGVEKLPQTPGKLRRGSFADGFEAIR